MHRIAWVVSLAISAAVASAAWASVVVALSVEELTARSDVVVLGEVASVDTHWSSDHRHLFRRIIVRARETWKGAAGPGAEVALVVPGGELDGVNETVIGEPVLREGDVGAFFLEPAGNTHRIVGLSQGFFRQESQGLVQHTGDLALARPGTSGYMIAPHGTKADSPVDVDSLRNRVLRVAESQGGRLSH
jgi:hypothetical protein